MPYATEQDLADTIGADELVQLADHDMDGVADQAVVEQALSYADAAIDGYVAVRYDLPLASTPALLTRLAIDLAHERLYPHGAPEAVAKRAEQARATLKDIASGKAKLDVAGKEPESAPGLAQFEGPQRRFSRGSMEGF